jgi:hypothetical protein
MEHGAAAESEPHESGAEPESAGSADGEVDPAGGAAPVPGTGKGCEASGSGDGGGNGLDRTVDVEQTRASMHDEATVPKRVDERIRGCLPYRDWLCRRRGNLTLKELSVLTQVTFLSEAEIKNIENVFELLVELMHSQGPGYLQTVTRRSSSTGERHPRPRQVVALSATQLEQYLPEFGSSNVFFDRLVRIFSESGEQKLTLLELIDLYSAMSPRANRQWKCRIAFCMLDYDEDGVLGQRDVVKALQNMIRGTQKSKMKQIKPSDAARHIQAVWKGRHTRIAKVKAAKDAEELQTHRQLKQASRAKRLAKANLIKHTHAKTKLECYADKVLEKCNGIRPHCMEYRHFLDKMTALPQFFDNFTLVPTKVEIVQQLIGTLKTVGGKLLAEQFKVLRLEAAQQNSAAPSGSPTRMGWRRATRTKISRSEFDTWRDIGEYEWDEQTEKGGKPWLKSFQVDTIIRHLPSESGTYRDYESSRKAVLDDLIEKTQKEDSYPVDAISRTKFEVWWDEQDEFTVQKYKARLMVLSSDLTKDWCERTGQDQVEEDQNAEKGLGSDQDAMQDSEVSRHQREISSKGSLRKPVVKAIFEIMHHTLWQAKRDRSILEFHSELIKRIRDKFSDPKKAKQEVAPDPLSEIAGRAFDDWDNKAKGTKSKSGQEETSDGIVTLKEYRHGLKSVKHSYGIFCANL